MTTTIDIQSVIDTLALLHEPDEVFEIRILDAPKGNGYKVTIAGYFDSYEAAAKAITPYNGKANVYTTLNPIDPALLARAYNRLVEQGKADVLTADKNIVKRRWLPLDFDFVRPAKISTTQEELEAARVLAREVQAYLSEWGWPAPVEASSGNGAHRLYRVDLPNDQESTDLLKSAIEHLSAKFNHAVKLDTTVYNAARIWKVYGTVAVKGDNIPTRPHRLAVVQKVPPDLEIVTPALLKTFALLPTAPVVSPNPIYRNGTGYTESELESALIGLNVSYHKKSEMGRVIYALDRCLTSDAHRDGACITLETGGKAGYKCHHDSCSTKDWQAVKPLLFPQRQNQKPNEQSTSEAKERRVMTAEYITALTRLGYRFALSDLDETLFINDEPATDAIEAKIRTQMRDIGYSHVNVMRDAYIAHAYENRFNPVADYLNSLKWDGTERLDILISHFTDNKATPGHTAPLFGLWLKKWMVGAAAKVFKGHQNPMLVLASRIRYTDDGKKAGQGVGKSFFVKWLCSGLPDYFLSSEIYPHDKDYKKRTLTHFIWEIDELGSTTRKADVEALKAFITMPVVTIRPSYGRNDIKKHPMVSFIGTVNFDGVGFLPDPTGNRRFLTVEVVQIDHNYTRLDVNQVWAEAMHLYRTGFDYDLSAEEMAVRDDSNRDFERVGVYDDKILANYEITRNAADVATTDSITKRLIEVENVRESERGLQMEIAKLFTREGLSSKQRPSRWYGVRQKGA